MNEEHRRLPALIHNGSIPCRITGVAMTWLLDSSTQEAKLPIRRLFGEPNVSKGKLAVAKRIFTTNPDSWVSYPLLSANSV